MFYITIEDRVKYLEENPRPEITKFTTRGQDDAAIAEQKKRCNMAKYISSVYKNTECGYLSKLQNQYDEKWSSDSIIKNPLLWIIGGIIGIGLTGTIIYAIAKKKRKS